MVCTCLAQGVYVVDVGEGGGRVKLLFSPYYAAIKGQPTL